MPHKHKRKRDDDVSNFDLAPNTRVTPLAAYTKASIFSKQDDVSSTKRRKPNTSKANKPQDDTPKAFARMMTWQTTGRKPNGLDDGTTTKSKSKKQQKQQQQQRKQKPQESEQQKSLNDLTTSESTPQAQPPPPPPPATKPSTAATTPRILPGESLSTFALRVDQSLPLHGMTRSTNANLPTDLQAKLKKAERTTKHNKRLQRMQADWRSTETKLREREADAEDEMEEHREEEAVLWSGVAAENRGRKGKKLRRGGGTVAKDEEDPWKELERKRRDATKQKGLMDVVKAPPVLKKVKSKFKAREEDFDAVDGKGGLAHHEDVLVDVGDVPGRVGSLRRREELNATRRAVIEGYRKLQGKKRGVGERLSMSRAVMT